MNTIAFYSPVHFASGRLTYEQIDDVRGLLNLYTKNLMQLYEYLLCRVDGPSQLLSVSSIDRLFNRLWQVCEGGMKDIEALTEVIRQCPDITNCGDFKLPWCFIKARLIYRQVNRGTHPVIRLYRQHEYLFCSVERTLHCTSYRARHLFD